MRASAPPLALALALSALAPLTGCDDARDPTVPPADTAVVAEAAGLAAVTISDGDRAVRLVADLLSGSISAPIRSDGAPLDRDAGSPLPPDLGGSGPSTRFPVCPAAGESTGGLDASCAGDAAGLRFEFGGAIETERGPATIEGTLAAVLASPPSASAARYDVSLAATVAAPGGTATWSGSGPVEVDVAGAVAGLRLAVDHTLAGERASSFVATSAAVDVRVPSGAASVRFFVDRGSGSGTAQWNGATVALLSFAGGCLHLDYLDPARADQRACPGP